MKASKDCPIPRIYFFLIISGVIFALGLPATAATLCVNSGGTSGCYKTIMAAVTAAAPNDTIQVAAGTYQENVVIAKPLSLLGAGKGNTIIDASGMSNGLYIDGIDTPQLRDVLVKGFSIRNAKYEGILIANASFVTLADNHVVNNDKSLVPGPDCPGIPSFETAEGFDCGEGVHLSGADHTTVTNNYVADNAGGILISDDTGAAHDNLITGNVVQDNPFDCGITLASHPPAALTNSNAPLGVFRNTIANNISRRNGLKGEGAGVGIFDSIPGTRDSANVVIQNVLTGNGLPGVALHSHAPGQDLTDNAIIGNYIAGNGKDTDDAATPGPTGINVLGVSPASGTVISQNLIRKEAVDVAVNTGAEVEVHLNNFIGHAIGVDNLNSGTVNATGNWWGCAKGPGAAGCARVSGSGVLVGPWLATPFISGDRDH
jgi:parallel beta-helix repeat protein